MNKLYTLVFVASLLGGSTDSGSPSGTQATCEKILKGSTTKQNWITTVTSQYQKYSNEEIINTILDLNDLVLSLLSMNSHSSSVRVSLEEWKRIYERHGEETSILMEKGDKPEDERMLYIQHLSEIFEFMSKTEILRNMLKTYCLKTTV